MAQLLELRIIAQCNDLCLLLHLVEIILYADPPFVGITLSEGVGTVEFCLRRVQSNRSGQNLPTERDFSVFLSNIDSKVSKLAIINVKPHTKLST